jgi:CRISPR system Cascade subunit CasD
MNTRQNTLFIRLAGPMQSWGTSSRFQLRRTDNYPSKSGVLGLLLCALGISRADSRRELKELTPLMMGLRTDHSGTLDWDYQTAGATTGIRSAEGKIKRTASTGEYEAQLSRRQYLYEASFLVALQGPTAILEACANALENPVWPIFLGRKCCVPSEPVFAGRGDYEDLDHALSSVPWRPAPNNVAWGRLDEKRTLDTYMDHATDSQPPDGAKLVHDVPREFGFHDHGPRWVVPGKITVTVEVTNHNANEAPGFRRVDYQSAQWREARLGRLQLDNYLCVFCKSEAQEVHHATYANVGRETNDDLRSLCKVCHDACTMLEYGRDLQLHRIDPSDPAKRDEILEQINRILTERRLGRRRELLETSRLTGRDFFEMIPAT